MKKDKDYEVLDDSFTKEDYIYISDNPIVWEDEPVYFIFDNYKVKEETKVRFSYKVFVDGKNMGTLENIRNNVLKPQTFYKSTISLESRELSITGKKGQVEIKDIVGLRPTSSVEVTIGGTLSEHEGKVTVLKLPTISGGKDLGEQYKAFTFIAKLDSDSSRQTKVTAILEGETIYSTIGTSTTHNIVVNDEVLKKLTSNKQYSITVKAEDSQKSSKNSSTTFTFTKISDPPILNIEDKDFGKILNKPIIEYSLTKGENVTIREKIEDKEVRNFKATIGETYQFEMSDEDWQGFSPNKVITATIEAEDEYGQVTTKTFTFEKIITRIEIKGKTPTKTDDKVTKVLLRPILRSMEGVKTVNIYACNNGLDNEPTWEDISENSLLHNVSFLENDSKTSEEWAFNLKIVIEREEGYDGEIILDALGGAFE